MALTAKQIEALKPESKPYTKADGRGLSIEIAPTGGRWWRFKYRHGGKQKRLSLGTYPDIDLKTARERREEMRQMVARGIDPLAQRKAEKVTKANTFESVARAWFEKNRNKWSARTWGLVTTRVEKDLIGELGARPIAEITRSELRDVLERVQGRGALETAHRLRQDAALIFRHAEALELTDRNPADALRDVLHVRTTKHHAAVTGEKELGALLRAIHAMDGDATVRAAMRMLPYVFVRPGELRAAAWSEFDLDAAEWRIPIGRMKMRVEHIVPLAPQVVAILREQQALTKGSDYVFPSVRSKRRPLSENTLNACLRRLGYSKDKATAHGFRSTATTLLNESGLWHVDAIERQLAHAEGNKVRAAYNKAAHLAERRRMMIWYADHLDKLRDADLV